MHRITPFLSFSFSLFNSPVPLSFFSVFSFSAFLCVLSTPRFRDHNLNFTMDKGDAGIYKFSRRGGPDLSLRNQNPSSGDNRIQQPPWKLGISGSSGGSAGGSHHKSQKSHSPEKARSSTADTTKAVRRSSSRSLGTRVFEEKHKQKRSYVVEGSSSIGTDTGKSATQVLAEAGDIPDFDTSAWTRGTGSSSSSRFLPQKNKQINLGNTSNGTGTGMHRRSNMKSLGCTSVSDVKPSGTEGVRKRQNGEGSSSVARSPTSTAADSYVDIFISGVSRLESRISREIARNSGTDLWAPQADRMLASSQEDQREEGEVEEEDVEEDEEEEEEEEDEAQPSHFAFLLPHQLYASSSRSRLNSGSGSGSGLISNSTSDFASGLSSRMAPWHGDEESGRTSHRTVHHGLRLRDREAYRRDGIAEVLSALERIEQHGEMSYAEQMMILETNILLNGLTFRDEHRDMRMDIDSMSYEELLALEEKMGTVSTALSEEEFANCLKKSIYHEAISHSIDDVKCCICQEEYEDGEEIGMLKCEHWYHVSCIHEWLSQKNWCPVCKASQNDR